MSIHRHLPDAKSAAAFAEDVRAKGGKAKVFPPGKGSPDYDVEWSPIGMKGTPKEPRVTAAKPGWKTTRDFKPRTAQKTLDGSSYHPGSGCGRGQHVWANHGTYLKCSVCGSSRSLR